MDSSNRKIGLYHSAYEHDACGVGFIANIKGVASHELLRNAQVMLERMTHRTALSADNVSGDGSGIMTAIPHRYFAAKYARLLNITLPERGDYAIANLFLPADSKQCSACQEIVAREVATHKLRLLFMHALDCDPRFVGKIAAASAPRIYQVAIANSDYDRADFVKILFVLRKRITHHIRGSAHDPQRAFYFCSLSSSTIVYKGMLTPFQLFRFYTDLQNPDFETHYAMIHSRFSTNTFPSWERAQPMRYISHNGEINTLRGNINKMHAREGALLGERNKILNQVGLSMKDMVPIIDTDTSDSGSFDNVLEFLLQSDYTLPQAIMMMAPQAWEHDPNLDADIKAMYEYTSNQIEPWDGPATISFSDGRYIGAVLDRNGLRPSRYYVTDDDEVIMASEVGVLPVLSHKIIKKGRLQPGKMFLVDFHAGAIIDDDALKRDIAHTKPYRKWIKENRISLSDRAHRTHFYSQEQIACGQQELRLFGYTTEHIGLLIKPMIETGKDPIGSMGNDAPLAILSRHAKLIYDYFHQLFAQVTNPPIDSIRESLIMTLQSHIGPEQSIQSQTAAHCRRVLIESPILLSNEYHALLDLADAQFSHHICDITYEYSESQDGLQQFLTTLCKRAEDAVDHGCCFLVLSDRKARKGRMPISPLLAVGAIHQHLIYTLKRTRVALIIDSAEPHEVHHFCTLLAYGADAIHPYFVLALIAKINDDMKQPIPRTNKQLYKNYRQAIHYGMRKVFGKMGISTLESYKGAQIFEILGLDHTVVDVCFRGSASRIGGASFAILEEEARMRYRSAFPERIAVHDYELDNPGEYQWRTSAELHQWNPEAITHLQHAVQSGEQRHYELFLRNQSSNRMRGTTLRGIMQIVSDGRNPLPISAVESTETIIHRFTTGAMSFGSISSEAHETLALAMNRIGAKSNTGEGGEDPKRFIPLPNGDSLRSSIKQIASGRFGVGIEYLTNADEIQIKMAQGAKPGEGGELPGHKVYEVIARTRNSTPGVGLISPPPHHDIYSIEDLAQLIFDLKNANPRARISVKLVSEVGVGVVAAGVVKALADHILISGFDGGTGASPLTGIKHAGLPWEIGVAETHQTLSLNGLRDRVVLQTDGQLKTGRDVVIAALLGAEEYGFSTAPLIAMGCIMMRVCHLNTCPVGIATQNEQLRKNFKGRASQVIAYFKFVAEEIRALLATLGFKSLADIIGRTDLLQIDKTVTHWKSRTVSLASFLPHENFDSKLKTNAHRKKIKRSYLNTVLDARIVHDIGSDFADGQSISLTYPIQNSDRTVGAFLSNHIIRTVGNNRLVDDAINILFTGSAGQSFGAWLTRGVTMTLIGDANDYVGKGLSGGKLIIRPPLESRFKPEEQILIGNVALYGALRGYAFFRGKAAERFCVRNSGAHVVVEGVGDHGCEYMTGGRAVIIGDIGRNFGAGMSGGIAYIWDPHEIAIHNINTEIVNIEILEEEDERIILELLRDHARLTRSTRAQYILENFEQTYQQFIRIIAPSYRQVIELQRERTREVALE